MSSADKNYWKGVWTGEEKGLKEQREQIGEVNENAPRGHTHNGRALK